MEVLIKTPMFLEQVRIHRVGAVKERLYVENLCEILVPAIGRDEQASIVSEVRTAHAKLMEARRNLSNAQQIAGEKVGRYVQVVKKHA
ncbi:MAG: restriction endonuclease subunit S [Xanthobacteraceae bacterium]